MIGEPVAAFKGKKPAAYAVTSVLGYDRRLGHWRISTQPMTKAPTRWRRPRYVGVIPDKGTTEVQRLLGVTFWVKLHG